METVIIKQDDQSITIGVDSRAFYRYLKTNNAEDVWLENGTHSIVWRNGAIEVVSRNEAATPLMIMSLYWHEITMEVKD